MACLRSMAACVRCWAGVLLALLRLAGANASFVRFLAIYTFVLTALYSLISYKTPWCVLSFWHGMILLAGVGAVVLWLALGAWAARRSARSPVAGWREWWREYLWLLLPVWGGTLAALAIMRYLAL